MDNRMIKGCLMKVSHRMRKDIAYIIHLLGTVWKNFYELYRIFLPLFREHREYFMIGVR